MKLVVSVVRILVHTQVLKSIRFSTQGEALWKWYFMGMCYVFITLVPFPGHTGKLHFPATLAVKKGLLYWVPTSGARAKVIEATCRPGPYIHLVMSSRLLFPVTVILDAVPDWTGGRRLSDMCCTFFFFLARNKHLLCYTTNILAAY